MGSTIDRKVEMLLSFDTPVGIAKSMGLGLIGFADALNELQPDLIVVLGDRFEIFAAVSAALVARIPVAHLHGGEGDPQRRQERPQAEFSAAQGERGPADL